MTAVARRFVSVDRPGAPHAHGCSVLSTGDEVLVAWFTGSREGAADTRAAVSSSRDLATWSAPDEPVTGAGPAWNPVLAADPAGDVVLFVHHGPDPARWRTRWSRRTRSGWTPAVDLVPGPPGAAGRGPSRNHPVVVGDRWLAPGSREDRRPWRSFVDTSADAGITWQVHDIPVVPGVDLIQPALVVLPGEVLAFLRADDGRVHRSRSVDGTRWGAPEPVPLPGSNSGLDVVALPDGRLVCAHHRVAGNWAPRCPLLLSVSDDRGDSWSEHAVVEDGASVVDPAVGPGSLPGPGGFDRTLSGVGEYSYPSLALHGDRLLVGYTWQRRGIVLASLPLP